MNTFAFTKRLTFFACLLVIYSAGCTPDQDTTTLPVLKSSTTADMSGVMKYTATFTVNITDEGGSPVTSRGICWSEHVQPTIADDHTSDGSGAGKFTSQLTNLKSNTTYYLRAYATNSAGTVYGEPIVFTTLPENGLIVTDIDGNIYHTVTIGTQVWLKENLNTAHYRNGDPIPYDSIGITSGDVSGSQCIMYHNSDLAATYGRLYNWYAVADSRKIAPEGWHIPKDYEWQALILFAGGENSAGGKLKELGTDHWASPNTAATDEFGFCALPGGCRLTKQYNFFAFQTDGRWWSATEENTMNAWVFNMFSSDKNVYSNFQGKPLWHSVRCVRD